ncbi:MAG: protein kinase [Hyphomicrobiaceae bacterium]
MDHREVLRANTVLDRKYRIDRVIGAGGFGITYQAFDIGLAAPVAVKEYYPSQFGMRDASMSVRPRTSQDRVLFDRLLSSFLREARTLAQFDHTAIVRVLSVFEAHGTAYMVMRFESGPSFKSWLQTLGRPPRQAELDRILWPLLDAIELMHMANFLHRDIAPDNIIVRADGTPVLLDFGASRRVVTEMSGTLTGVVKQGYSPQEQYSSDVRAQGPWTDIYALSATLYLAVTGKVPSEATARMLEDGLMPALEGARGGYRPEFLAAIDAAMRLHPRDRPQSIAAWREMLFEGAEVGWFPESGGEGFLDNQGSGPGGIRVPSSMPRSSPGAYRVPPTGDRAGTTGALRSQPSRPRSADRPSPRSAESGPASLPRSSSRPRPTTSASEARAGGPAAASGSLASQPVVTPTPPEGPSSSARRFGTRGAVVLGVGAMLVGGGMLLAFDRGRSVPDPVPTVEPSNLDAGREVARQRAEAERRETERRAEIARQQELARQQAAERERAEAARREADRQAEIARQAELQRQQAAERERAEAARREAERKAEIARQQEAERKRAEAAEAERQAALQRQLEITRRQEAERREAERKAEVARQQEAERKRAEAAEAERQAALQRQLEITRRQEAERREAERKAEFARQQEAERKRVEAAEAERQAALQRQLEITRRQEAERRETERKAEIARQQEAERKRQASAAAIQPPAGPSPARQLIFADPSREPGVFAAALAPAGDLVLAGGNGGRVRLWDPSANQAAELAGRHAVAVTAISVLADRQRAVTASADGEIHIWELATGRLLRTVAASGKPVAAIHYWTPQRVIVLYATGAWSLIEPDSGQTLLAGSKDVGSGVTAASFAATGKTVWVALTEASGSPVVEAWVPSDANATRVSARYLGHTARIDALAASHDGRLVATAALDGTMRVWDGGSGQELRRLEATTAPIAGLAFSRTGALVAGAASDGTVRVWQVSDGRLVQTLAGHARPMRSVAFSEDGAFVTGASEDGLVSQWALPAQLAALTPPPIARPQPAKPAPEPAVATPPRPKAPPRAEEPPPRRERVREAPRPERSSPPERRSPPRGGGGDGGGRSGGGSGGGFRLPAF